MSNALIVSPRRGSWARHIWLGVAIYTYGGHDRVGFLHDYSPFP